MNPASTARRVLLRTFCQTKIFHLAPDLFSIDSMVGGSEASFVLAATWGLIVLCGLHGWGLAVFRALRCNPPSWGIAAAIGFAFSVFSGGLLGLAHLIHSAEVISFILTGIALSIFLTLTKSPGTEPFSPSQPLSKPRERWSPLLMALLIALVAWRYLGEVKSIAFNPLDDISGYLVFPVKMLQTGFFAPDPYSDRRLSSLGGQPWSQVFTLSLFDISTVMLFDRGVALIILLLIIAGWLKKLNLGRSVALGILLVVALHYPNLVNITSFITVSALFLSLFVMLTDPPGNLREGVVIALLVSATCSLKSTAVPFVGSVCSLYFSWLAWKTRSFRPMALGFAIAILAAIFLFPWMLAMRASSGTLLWPILGQGFSRLPPLIGTLSKHSAILLMLFAAATFAAGLFTYLCLRCDTDSANWRTPALIFFAASAPIVFAVGAQTGGANWVRFPQPFLYGLIPLPLAASWIAARRHANRPLITLLPLTLAVLLLILPLAWLMPQHKENIFALDLHNIKDGMTAKSLTTTRDLDQARQMQSAIPPGQAVITRLNYPHLLNFVRNPVYLNDHPGLVGPPGPVDSPDPKTLAAYFVAHSVRYVALSYIDEANFFPNRPANYQYPYAWYNLLSRQELQFQKTILAMKDTHHVIYDDGVNLVIDMRSETP